MTSSRPLSGTASWQTHHEIGIVGKVAAIPVVACASVHYCVAPIGGETHYVEIRTTKLLDSTLFSWSYGQYLGGDPYPLPDSAWCSSSGVCVVGAVVGSPPYAHSEVDVSQGPNAKWIATRFPSNEGVVVACASVAFCVAGGIDQPASGGYLTGLISVGRV